MHVSALYLLHTSSLHGICRFGGIYLFAIILLLSESGEMMIWWIDRKYVWRENECITDRTELITSTIILAASHSCFVGILISPIINILPFSHSTAIQQTWIVLGMNEIGAFSALSHTYADPVKSSKDKYAHNWRTPSQMKTWALDGWWWWRW